jgi:hypothetical protein
VTGADGGDFDFGYSRTANYSSDNLSQCNTSYSSLSPDLRSGDLRSGYVNDNNLLYLNTIIVNN